MKKLLLFFVAALMLSVVFVSSCKDEDDDLDLKTVLTTGKWYPETVDITMTALGKSNTYTLQDCEKDDYLEFKADGSLTATNGTVVCDDDETAAGATESGTWSLSNGDKTFTFLQDGSPMVYTVKSFTETKITLTQDYTTTDLTTGISINYKGSFVAVKK